MNFRKTTAGTSLGRSPITSAGWVNGVSEAVQYYHDTQRLGSAQRGTGLKLTTDLVKCTNTTDTGFVRGDCIELDGYNLSPVNHRSLWFDGKVYDGSGVWGIVREAIAPSGEGYGFVQLSGVCTAKVNVTNIGHTHASPTASSRNFTSGPSGDLELLDTPGSTGVQEIAVRFPPSQPSAVPFTCMVISTLTGATWDNANKRLTPAANTNAAVFIGWDDTYPRYAAPSAITPEWVDATTVNVATDKARVGKGMFYDNRYQLFSVSCEEVSYTTE